MRLNRSSFYYEKSEKGLARRDYLRMKIKDIAGSRPRFGYLRITALLRREGIRVSKNTVYKLYKQEELELKKKKSNKFKKRPSVQRTPLAPARYAGERWSVDFTHDHLVGGKHLRTGGVSKDSKRVEKRL